MTHIFLHQDLSGQFHAPAALSLGKEPRYALVRRLGGLQSRSGRCGEEKHLLALSGIEPGFLGRPGRGLLSIPTEGNNNNNIVNITESLASSRTLGTGNSIRIMRSGQLLRKLATLAVWSYCYYRNS
jgi:hypothetical protein